MAKPRRGTCPECGRRYPLRRDGSVQGHKPRGVTDRWAECAGSGKRAKEHDDG